MDQLLLGPAHQGPKTYVQRMVENARDCMSPERIEDWMEILADTAKPHKELALQELRKIRMEKLYEEAVQWYRDHWTKEWQTVEIYGEYQQTEEGWSDYVVVGTRTAFLRRGRKYWNPETYMDGWVSWLVVPTVDSEGQPIDEKLAWWFANNMGFTTDYQSSEIPGQYYKRPAYLKEQTGTRYLFTQDAGYDI